MLAIADGALGFWNALDDLCPQTRQQLCWVHEIANVLDKLPKRLQTRAKQQLHEIMRAPTREDAAEEIAAFADDYRAKYSRAVECLEKDVDRLLTFFDFPAEHWIHIRTSNPIESTFAAAKTRTRQTKGAGSRKAALAMAFKLAEAAEERWRKINAPQLAAAVLAGIRYKNGERILPDRHDAKSSEFEGVAA